MTFALFWVIKQRAVVIRYRRFGTTSLSHLQGSRIPITLALLVLEDGPRYVVSKRPQGITTACCVITRNIAVLLHFAVEASTHAYETSCV